MENPSSLKFSSPKISELLPLILKSGCGALFYWRLNQLSVQPEIETLHLRQIYQLQKIQAAVHEHNIKRVFRLLHSAGLQPVLVKGWLAARLYPEPALRPFGDIDICVEPEKFDIAAELLNQPEINDVWVDLHSGFGNLDREPHHVLAKEFVVIQVGEVEILVPSYEDHLRILCLHLLRHGACRPLWLLDIAAALEKRPATFDWTKFYGQVSHREWLDFVIVLAHKLLGAQIENTPPAEKVKNLPVWLVKAVYRRWGRWFNSDYRDEAVSSLWRHRTKPLRLAEDLYFRFDPIRATVELNRAFNKLPRFPYQLSAAARRCPGALQKIKKLVKTRIEEPNNPLV